MVVWAHVADLPPDAPTDRDAIRDQDRGLPGEAAAGLLRALAEAGYDGPVTPEPMPECRSLQGLKAEEAVFRVAEAIQSVWPESPPRRVGG